MWAKQQCYGAGEPEKGETKIKKAHCTLKYILKLSLCTPYAQSLVLVREFVVGGVGPRLHSSALLRGVHRTTLKVPY